MRIDFRGRLVDEPEIRAGLVGCGSHSFRNICPTFQFAPVNFVATCDLSIEKAQAFAAKFGARGAYADYREMLAREELDAVFLIVGYDSRGHPAYPQIAEDCFARGCHVWMEKPPAATCTEIEHMQQAAAGTGRQVVVDFKKMFAPANEHALRLASSGDFGRATLVTLQYPESIPTAEHFDRYLRQDGVSPEVVGFLDHLCHPVSLLVYLLGFPQTLCYSRSSSGSGVATFTFAEGAVASLALTGGAAYNGGMERTLIVSGSGGHIIVENNIRVSYHRDPISGYGDVPSYFAGPTERATAIWEPEFSLGQLYNKGLFLLGYYQEVNEFARAILDGQSPRRGTLEQAWQITRIFEAFGEGPDRTIPLGSS